MNKIPALVVVTTKPRDLTRKQLKELKLLLDQEGYNETILRTAWKETNNVEIAASIIGFIRQSVLEKETIVDRTALDSGRFKEVGGFNRLNKVFDGKMNEILGEISDELWKDTATG